MSNYINKHSILGLMNKNAYLNIDVTELSFYKTKAKNKVVFFKELSEEDEAKYTEVNYMYLDEKPERKIKGMYKMSEVISVFDNKYFRNIRLCTDKELYQTLRKYRINREELKIIEFSQVNPADYKELQEDIVKMIEVWRYSDKGGMKYGWQEHAGIDKAFFERFFKMKPEEQDEYQVLFFVYQGTLMGYSVIEKEPDINGEYKYLIRKCITESPDGAGWRNLCLYIDYITFEQLWMRNDLNKFYVNWGASSRGALWYKMHKFPLFATEDRWFATVKNK